MFSTADIIFSTAMSRGTNSIVTVIRGFKILRLLQLAKSMKKLQEMLLTIDDTLKDLRNFILLLFIFMFAYTLFGMEFFAYKIRFDEFDRPNLEIGLPPRTNFDGFFNGFFTVFQEIQGDTWELIMYNSARMLGS